MVIRRTAVAAALLAAPLAFAAPAMADSNSVVDCSPCASRPGINLGGGALVTGIPTWEQLANGSWEKVWPGRGQAGIWEKAQSGVWEKAQSGSWEKATAGGAWEKAFPPAE